MLPYQAVAMDYRHQAAAAAAFTHSWFVPPDLCVPYKHTTVEPGILELRKEKSRDAARSRRGKENYEFYELAKMLPLPAAITSQLDKASIIRLTISYLKLRDFSGHGDPPWNRDQPSPKSVKSGVRGRPGNNLALDIFELHQGTHILQSLDGFAFALGADGRFLYISETVSIYLGLSQVEMTGSSVFDYVHQQDHTEMAEQLGLGLNSGGSGIGSPQGSEEGSTSSPVSTVMSLSTTNGYKGLERTFCVRMKSTLTKRGCHFKSSGYRVVLLLCRLRPQYQFSHNRKTPPPLLGMVSLAIALPPPSVHEIRLESDMFITRLNFDFTIAHCEPRVADLLEYTADEITGMNMYTLCHGEDANRLRKSHIDLINKGQVLTHYYRLMNKNGGYTWIQTCATVICNNKNADEQNIICINYVVSGKEYKNLIMDCCQLEEHVKAQRVKREDTSGNDPENGSPGSDTGEGRSSGGGRVQERHLGPSELEEESPDLAGDQRGRGHMDHIHPPDHQQINNVLTRPHKKTGERRASKRKNDDESSYSSDEDVANGGGSGGAGASGGQPVRKRYPILSPASSSCQSSALAGSPKAGNEVDSDSAAGGTVKELEQAMSKHLPPPPQDKTSAVAQQHTDFSTDALLKAQQRSTIQWIGALQQQHAPGPGGGPLPASTLLRQLYANRESVIRANVTTRGGGYYGPDMIGPLPTPPGSEGSGGAYGGPQDYNALYPNYSAAAAAAAAVEYHSAMTPPSSVSPRDKHQPAAGPIMTAGFDSPPVGGPYATHDMLRSSYLDQPLPLKPQPYAHHHLDPSSYAAAAAAAATTAAASLEQSAHQFYAATGANTPAAATAFHHLYNKHPPPGTAAASPSANWYTSPS